MVTFNSVQVLAKLGLCSNWSQKVIPPYRRIFATSLFTFLLISIRLRNRSSGRIYELNGKVETADLVERFVQFSALCKQY